MKVGCGFQESQLLDRFSSEVRINGTVDKREKGSGPVENASDCRLVSLSASSLHGTLL